MPHCGEDSPSGIENYIVLTVTGHWLYITVYLPEIDVDVDALSLVELVRIIQIVLYLRHWFCPNSPLLRFTHYVLKVIEWKYLEHIKGA